MNLPYEIGLLKRSCRLQSRLARCLLTEFVATTFLIYVGLCIEAQAQLAHLRSKSHPAFNPTALGWGLTLVLAVQIAFRTSGAHLNPAVSLFSYSLGQLPFVHFLLYSMVQTLAGFIGAALTFALYYEKIVEFDGGNRSVVGSRATAPIFATFPAPHLGMIGAIVDQISCTFILCFSIGVITDDRNKIPKVAQPPLMGVMLAMVCMGFNLNAGNAMNPARDFGPRFFCWMAGYGWEVFSFNNYTWFWVPILCPFAGALLGVWTYQLVISAQMPRGDQEDGEEVEEGVMEGAIFGKRISAGSDSSNNSMPTKLPISMI